MKKGIIRILILVVITLTIATMVVQVRARAIMEDFLDRKLPENIALSYANMSVNFITGCAELSGVRIEVRSLDTDSLQAYVTVDQLRLGGFGHLKFAFNNTIHADRFEFISPHFVVYPDVPSGKAADDPSTVVALKRTISIDRFMVSDGEFTLIPGEKSGTAVHVRRFDLSIDGPITDPEILAEDIPFHYADYTLSAVNAEVDINAYERLFLDYLKIEDKDALLKGLSIKSRQSRKTLSDIAPVEHEHLSILAPVIRVKDLDLGSEEKRFQLTSSALKIESPTLDIFLDKLLPDRTAHQILYSRYLREIPIDLQIDRVHISEGNLKYTELREKGIRPGEITVASFDMELADLNNRQNYSGTTTCTLRGLFMDTTPLELEVEFSIQDTTDHFLAHGSLIDVDEPRINPMLEACYRTRFEGDIDRLYFTFTANPWNSSGDLKMRYSDLKMVVLNKERNRMNHLLSTLGNLVISDKKPDAEGYRHGAISAERDPTKSIFNFLWMSIRSGIKSTLTEKVGKDK